MDVNDSNQQQQQSDHQNVTSRSKKKCHGNRRDQRFRKRCRARKMKPSTMTKLLQRRKRIQTTTTTTTGAISTNVNSSDKNQAKQMTNNSNMKTFLPLSTTIVHDGFTQISMASQKQITTTTTHCHKRKRHSSYQELKINQVMVKSTSSASITQSLSKKIKTKTKSMTNLAIKVTNKIINKNYRRPLYLKRSSLILLKRLSQTMKYSLKGNEEQTFIYTRLNLLDQQHYLIAEKHLWQSYIDISLTQHLWPDRLCTMAKTNDFDLCQQYMINYMETLEKQVNECVLELVKQSQTCPIQTIPLDQIDQCLKEMVDRERKYLLTRNARQLERFKNEIYRQDFLRQISTYHLTMNQNESLRRLLTIQQQQGNIWKELLMLETRILCKVLPSNFDDLEQLIAPPNLYSPMINNSKVIQFNNRRSQIIKEAKRNWLDISFHVYEFTLQEFEEQYRSELKQLETQLLNDTTNAGNSTVVYKHLQEYLIYERTKLKNDIHSQVALFRRKLLQQRRNLPHTKHTFGVSSEPYLDLISNPFTKTEWTYLSLGSSCIRVNQSALRSQKQQKIEIRDEHKEISNKVQNDLVRFHYMKRTLPIFKEYSDRLLDHLNHAYFTPLSYKDHIQAFEQVQIVRSIRKKIKTHNLVIRLTDKSNNFYIGLTSEFEKKVQKFFSDTNAFMELSINPFHEILNRVIQLLNQLQSKGLIKLWQYNQMLPDRTKCELAHLYFNPKTHKDSIPVRPIESTIHASTRKISKFLDQLIRPIFNDKCRTTNIIDGTSLINELHKYIAKDLFKSSTLFCTFDIHNLYTMLPQDEALDILIEFLQLHGYKRVNGIDLQTIRELASIVLKENVFAYGNKIYKQILGGAMGSSLTLTLANIFMWKWQRRIVRLQEMTGGFYGRYIDDIFMTWNHSEQELLQLLDAARKYHRNIQFEYKIGLSLPFLDVFLMNNNGKLLTSVYHKPTTEPYVIPFISDHPRHTFVNIIKTSLTRAIRYSSTFQTFNYERRHIKLTLLYNGYPSTFIDNEFHKFFLEYESTSPFLPHVVDEKQFFRMRQVLLGQPTQRQSQVALSAATADTDNDQTDEQIMEKENNSIAMNKQINSGGDKFFVHYTHEKRFQSLKRDMHQVYDEVFGHTPAMHSKLIVGNRNRRNAQHEFIRKRPKKALLQNKITQKQRKKKQQENINGQTSV